MATADLRVSKRKLLETTLWYCSFIMRGGASIRVNLKYQTPHWSEVRPCLLWNHDQVCDFLGLSYMPFPLCTWIRWYFQDSGSRSIKDHLVSMQHLGAIRGAWIAFFVLFFWCSLNCMFSATFLDIKVRSIHAKGVRPFSTSHRTARTSTASRWFAGDLYSQCPCRMALA